jgi:hypothetical protein
METLDGIQNCSQLQSITVKSKGVVDFDAHGAMSEAMKSLSTLYQLKQLYIDGFPIVNNVLDFNIKALTLNQAKAIYRRDYWTAAGCDRAPEAVRFDLLDMAVNSGVGLAIRTLQRAVGVADDGMIGPATLSALDQCDPKGLLARFNGARLQMMTDLVTWPTFGKGWARRIAANLMRV